MLLPLHYAAADAALAWPRHQFSAAAGIITVDIGDVAGSGTVFDNGPGSERPNLYAPDSVDASGGRLDYSFNSGASLPAWLDWNGRSSNLTFTASWADYDGDESSSRSEASGGRDVGMLYQEFKPPNKPIGYFPGATGLESTATTDIDYGRLEAGMQWLRSTDWLSPDTRLIPGIRLAWTQLDYYVRSSVTFDPAVVAPQEYGNRRDQQMQEDLFELRLGGRLERLFGSNRQFSVFGDLGLNYYFLKTALASFEYPTIAGTGRSYWEGDSERESFFGLDIGLGAGWQFVDNWQLNLIANYSPDVPTASIENPVSAEPGGSFTHSDASQEAHTSLSLGLTYGFGGR